MGIFFFCPEGGRFSGTCYESGILMINSLESNPAGPIRPPRLVKQVFSLGETEEGGGRERRRGCTGSRGAGGRVTFCANISTKVRLPAASDFSLCGCVRVRVCVRERERERQRDTPLAE